MAKRKKKKARRTKSTAREKGPALGVIAAVMAAVFAAGFIANLVLSPGPAQTGTQGYQVASSGNDSIEAKVLRVASNFRCACGGCGELPLDECTCNMARGAVEEKNFIRRKLKEGYSVDQVIEMVDIEYGHRNA